MRIVKKWSSQFPSSPPGQVVKPGDDEPRVVHEGLDMQGISGRVALITGGASGIGAGLVEAFARSDAKVIFADIQAEAGAAVARAIKGTVFQPTDLRKDED